MEPMASSLCVIQPGGAQTWQQDSLTTAREERPESPREAAGRELSTLSLLLSTPNTKVPLLLQRAKHHFFFFKKKYQKHIELHSIRGQWQACVLATRTEQAPLQLCSQPGDSQ